MIPTEEELDDYAAALAQRLNRLFTCPDGHVVDPELRSGHHQCPVCRAQYQRPSRHK